MGGVLGQRVGMGAKRRSGGVRERGNRKPGSVWVGDVKVGEGRLLEGGRVVEWCGGCKISKFEKMVVRHFNCLQKLAQLLRDQYPSSKNTGISITVKITVLGFCGVKDICRANNIER